ncbi:MAG: hypothetical protein JWP83_1324 [Mycobacterium sp.]|jgi:hypothetical protein|uniref:hypothetical protein n=1 Tax=Mycobacterium sp. TaxID=1785 RepID=UPI0026024130|nr:hypothetical protein [Mycobacterium sp.]MCW2660172.1 hypothetical protein [Mycobacterium sp.]
MNSRSGGRGRPTRSRRVPDRRSAEAGQHDRGCDQAGIQAHFQEISGDHEFSIFFKLDQGSTQRLAGFPLGCRFYLIGNAVIVNGLFQYGATAGLGAPVRVCVSQQDGEDVRIDLDEPTAFFSQFPEMKESKVPGILDRDLVKHLIDFAS